MADRVNRAGCLTTLAVLIGLPVAYWQYQEYRRPYGIPPADLEVSKVLFRTEQRWGPPLISLPGDAATSLIAYEIPQMVADQITKEGVAFFSKPENVQRRHNWLQTSFVTWTETPLQPDPHWGSENFEPRIEAYLDRYGRSIPIDKEIEKMIDQALVISGSYYSFGRIGMMIVIPSQRRAVFAHIKG